MAEVETWRSRPLAQADCNSCGERAPDGEGSFELPNDDDDAVLASFRRWARAHAQRNPGHLTIVESVRARCYQVPAAAVSGSREAGGQG